MGLPLQLRDASNMLGKNCGLTDRNRDVGEFQYNLNHNQQEKHWRSPAHGFADLVFDGAQPFVYFINPSIKLTDGVHNPI